MSFGHTYARCQKLKALRFASPGNFYYQAIRLCRVKSCARDNRVGIILIIKFERDGVEIFGCRVLLYCTRAANGASSNPQVEV